MMLLVYRVAAVSNMSLNRYSEHNLNRLTVDTSHPRPIMSD